VRRRGAERNPHYGHHHAGRAPPRRHLTGRHRLVLPVVSVPLLRGLRYAPGSGAGVHHPAPSALLCATLQRQSGARRADPRPGHPVAAAPGGLTISCFPAFAAGPAKRGAGGRAFACYLFDSHS
jgi:hypothetical protein